MALTAPQVWDALRSQSIFLTGGTGFIGRWLVESLLHADRLLGLGLRLTVLSRDPGLFLAAHPHLACPALRMHTGDITQFGFPQGEHAFAIHAALPVAGDSADRLVETARLGSERVAQFARQAATQRLLHISSGAVYGARAGEHGPISEDAPTDGAQSPNQYTMAKRTEEAVLADALAGRIVTARCFAFLGPGLSAATGTAAGQFMDRAARGLPVVLRGDGTPVRSYQYASDMARWLLTLLALGPTGRAFNVGSSEAVSIRDLAQRLHHAAGIAAEPAMGAASAPGRAGDAYVPSVERAARELGLANAVSLDEGIRRSLRAARAAALP